MNAFIFIVAFMLNLAIICVNISALYAYFQRNRLDCCKELVKRHIFYATLWGIFGILTFPGVVMATEKFRFGFKTSKHERIESEWWERVESAYRNRKMKEYARFGRRATEPAEGFCVSLWED